MDLFRLTSRKRSEAANWELAAVLAFTAGAVDVAGYLMFGLYTTHTTGATATLARVGVSSGFSTLAAPLIIVVTFIAGSAVDSILLTWLQRTDWESEYAIAVLVEAALLTLIWATGSRLRLLYTVGMLAFTMGLQNAMVTNISKREIRTTHVTAMMTDIGIQLGRLVYWNRKPSHEPVRADRLHLPVLLLLVSLFFVGGVVGAIGYHHLGLGVLLPFAGLLALLTVRPIAIDLRRRL